MIKKKKDPAPPPPQDKTKNNNKSKTTPFVQIAKKVIKHSNRNNSDKKTKKKLGGCVWGGIPQTNPVQLLCDFHKVEKNREKKKRGGIKQPHKTKKIK